MPYLVLLLATVAAATDLRSGRIPNWLTLPAVLGGVAWHVASGGATGAALALFGALGCGLVPWLMHRSTQGKAIGGGDIKLFTAIGAWLGPVNGLEVELSAFLFLVLLVAVQLAYQGGLLRVLEGSLRLALGPLVPARWRRQGASEALTEVRMGPAIALATALVIARTHWFPEAPWPL